MTPMPHPLARAWRLRPSPIAAACAVLVVALPAGAQKPTPTPPPKAQAWIDVATGHGLGLPGLGSGGGLPGLGAVLGGLRGSQPRNEFGRTVMSPAGRWVDVTLQVRGESLAEAQQLVPTGFLPQPLKLVAPPPDKVRPVPRERRRADRAADGATPGQAADVLGLRRQRADRST